jgi:hypothetical protein
MLDSRLQLVTGAQIERPAQTNPHCGHENPFGSGHRARLVRLTRAKCNDRAISKVLIGKSLDAVSVVKVHRSVKFHHNTIESNQLASRGLA